MLCRILSLDEVGSGEKEHLLKTGAIFALLRARSNGRV